MVETAVNWREPCPACGKPRGDEHELLTLYRSTDPITQHLIIEMAQIVTRRPAIQSLDEA